MSWTAPRTWVTDETVTAAHLNAHLRDNLLETGPAKATAQGALLYASGANSLARLGIGAENQSLVVASGLPAWSSSFDWVRRPSDTTITTTTTLANDSYFSFAVAANEKWQVSIYAYFIITSSGGFKSAFSLPAAATGFHGFLTQPPSSGSVTNDFDSIANNLSRSSIGTSGMLSLTATVINGANAGTAYWQWAQNSAAGSLTIKTNSVMFRQKLI